MTLRQLEYLLAVAQTGSFTEAASRLHVSQPTLSQQIRALEAELGGPLLDRSPGSVALTPAGKALVGDARAAVTSAQRALDAGRRALRSAPKLLTMATVRSLAAAVLPATIKRWHEVQPDVSIRLLEFASRSLVTDAVADGRADLAAIDCRSWALAQRFEDAAASLTVVGWTALRPGLPYITGRRTAPAVVVAMRSALAELAQRAIQPPSRRRSSG